MAEPTLDAALGASLRWMDDLAATGGPDFLPFSARKLEAERAEFVAEPSLDEAADVTICLVAACANSGWGIPDLAATMVGCFLGLGHFKRHRYGEHPLHFAATEVTAMLDHTGLLPGYAQQMERSRESFVAEPGLVEAAEIMACLLAVLRLHRWSLAAFSDAIDRKNVRNAARVWKRSGDGTFQHETAGASS